MHQLEQCCKLPDMRKTHPDRGAHRKHMELFPPRRPQNGRSLAQHLLSDTATHRFHTGSCKIRWSQYAHFDFMPAEHPAMWNQACRTAFTKNNASKPIFLKTRPPRARVDTLFPSLAGVLEHSAKQAGHFPAGNSRRKIGQKPNGHDCGCTWSCLDFGAQDLGPEKGPQKNPMSSTAGMPQQCGAAELPASTGDPGEQRR